MSNVFYQTGLTSLTIPANVAYIGEYCFVGLDNLTEFNVDENNPFYKSEDGLLLSKNGRKLIAVPAGREGTLNLPVSIESIGFGAFEGSRLTNVIFHEDANILTFGYRAFFDADNMVSLVVPESIISIDYYAFANCDNLETIVFHEDSRIKGIYEGAFYGDKKLKNITLPSSIVEISDYAFYDCEMITELPLEDIESLKGIYNYAMAYTGIKHLELPDNVIDLGDYAFKGSKLETVKISDARKKDLIIGIGAFEDCKSLKEMTLPFIGASFDNDKISWFGYIFGAGAYKANEAYIPDNIESVKITEGISFVDEYAFYGVKSLERIDLPESISEVRQYSRANQFFREI
jgi:hypothetical protein